MAKFEVTGDLYFATVVDADTREEAESMVRAAIGCVRARVPQGGYEIDLSIRTFDDPMEVTEADEVAA